MWPVERRAYKTIPFAVSKGGAPSTTSGGQLHDHDVTLMAASYLSLSEGDCPGSLSPLESLQGLVKSAQERAASVALTL